MNQNSMPQTVKVLLAWQKKGSLRFDLPIQRAENQWDSLQKSKLLHSVLQGYYIPPVLFVKMEDGDTGESFYSVLDGKQRLTSIFAYVSGREEDGGDGGFVLHEGTAVCTVEGVTDSIAGKSFRELPEVCRNKILSRRLAMHVMEDCTDEEREELFARIHASTPLTLIQKARTEMGTELAGWVGAVTRMPFFGNALALTPAQVKKECELEVLLQSMLLLDARDEGYDDKAISMAAVTLYCRSIRGNYPQEKRRKVENLLQYLGEAFPEKCKWLKKSNVPMAMVMGQIAIEQGIPAAGFKGYIDAFSNAVCPAFEANKGSGNIKRAKTEGRLTALFEYFLAHFKWERDGVAGPLYMGQAEESNSNR